MPLGKTGIQVETRIGDKTFDNEEVTDIYYRKNLQDGEKRAWGTNTHDMLPFGQQQVEIQPTTDAEPPKDEALEKAIADDLTSRGVPKTPPEKKPARKRRASAKKTTKPTTDK